MNSLFQKEKIYRNGSFSLSSTVCPLFIMIGVILALYIAEGIQVYKKQWDDISKLCFLSSLSGIAVLGDVIREWLPVNLLIMFLLINIAIMVLKMWMKEKFQE